MASQLLSHECHCCSSCSPVSFHSCVASLIWRYLDFWRCSARAASDTFLLRYAALLSMSLMCTMCLYGDGVFSHHSGWLTHRPRLAAAYHATARQVYLHEGNAVRQCRLSEHACLSPGSRMLMLCYTALHLVVQHPCILHMGTPCLVYCAVPGAFPCAPWQLWTTVPHGLHC